MSNAQDLLSILGGAGGGGASRAPGRGGGASTASGSSTETSILSFKAGKMNTTLKPNGKYMVVPDSRRGELHVVWTKTAVAAPPAASSAAAAAVGGRLRLEWRDRRTKTVVDTISVFPEDDATFERVETGRDGDRVYLLQCGASAEGRHFFWMQDKDASTDEDLCVKVNLYMGDYSEAAAAAANAPDGAEGGAGGGGAPPAGAPGGGVSNNPAEALSAYARGEGGGGGMDNAELLRIMQGALGSQGGAGAGAEGGARTATVPGSGSLPTAEAGQIDHMGNLLENPNALESVLEHSAGSGAGAPGGAAGGLTLADLQGAMAGLATASPPPVPPAGSSASVPGPPLSELAASDVIDASGILDDPAAVARLVALLPEGQRTPEALRDNVRSPQVAQCLQRLTAALTDEPASFNSIIANFQLDPNDGAAAMAAGNPVEAFLECLLRDVERREGIREDSGGGGGPGGEGKEDGDGGGESKEGGTRDEKMDES